MNRRGFLQALGAVIAAPAIVRAASLMPVRVLDSGLVLLDGELGVLDSGVRLTNFGDLSAAQKAFWSKEIWRAAQEQAFITKFCGGGEYGLILPPDVSRDLRMTRSPNA